MNQKTVKKGKYNLRDTVTDLENTTSSSKKYEFAANITHELKTPLTSIIGFVEYLKKSGDKDRQIRESIYDIIDSEAQRLLHLIDDVLLLSQIENNKDANRTEQECNIKHELDTVLKILLPLAENKKLQFYINVKDNVNVNISSIHLQQLLSNLISNAIKYNKNQGKIFIDSYYNKGLVIINIKDTGIGIDPEHTNKIFDRFYRVEANKNSGIPGNGLGLSIVKDIVNLYNGNIQIKSNIGDGTEFIVSFPLKA